MSRRPPVNPHLRGSAEYVLFDRHRRAMAAAKAHHDIATVEQAAGDAELAKAEHYAKALDALGHPVAPRRLEGPKS